MTRVAVALAVVVALASGVWLLWPDDEQPLLPSTTLPAATPTSTVGRSTTTTASLTTTTTEDLVDTVEEAEAILRELWFGWFDGIYHQDEDRIREVIVGSSLVTDAIGQFGEMSFSQQPTLQSIEVAEVEVLHADGACTAVWARITASFRAGSSAGVHVIRRHHGGWKLMSYWVYREDLWDEDCSVPLP